MDPTYGVADAGVADALDTKAALATRPVFGQRPNWDGIYRFPLGLAELELPDDDRQLRDALLGIYLATGMDGIARAWHAAQSDLDRFATPDAAELANEPRPGGVASPFEDEQNEINTLSRHRGLASRDTVARSRSHNADFRRRLVTAIDDLIIAAEEAQRWYETKLLQVIAAQLVHQKKVIEQAWKTYDIGDPDNPGPAGFVPIEDADTASGLAIRNRQDGVDIKRHDKAQRIQASTTTPHKVPAVVHALLDVGIRYREYRINLQARIDANKTRRRENAATLAIKQLPSHDAFVDSLRKHSATHFIVAAAFRDVVNVGSDMTLTADMEEHCERLVIEALRKAWTNCDVAAANAKADRLFVDEKPKSVIGRADMGIPAAQLVVEAAYTSKPLPDTYAAPHEVPPEEYQPAPPITRYQPAPPITRSPWLQAPFHVLVMTIAKVIATNANAPEPPVEHLLGLFEGADDRRRLLGMRTLPSFVARARDDMIAALEQHKELDEKDRRRIAQGIAVLGLFAAPITGGASIVVAGIVDAALVAGRVNGEIAEWIAAEQYSALAVDVLTAEAWREPAVSELVALVLEAGFEIAGDLTNEGVIAHLFTAIAMVELMAAGASYVVGRSEQAGQAP